MNAINFLKYFVLLSFFVVIGLFIDKYTAETIDIIETTIVDKFTEYDSEFDSTDYTFIVETDDATQLEVETNEKTFDTKRVGESVMVNVKKTHFLGFIYYETVENNN